MKDEFGLPIVKQALDQVQAIRMSMQGLTHACYTFWPDVVLFVSAFFIEAGIFEIMRKRRHKLVLLHTESPYQDEEQLDRGSHADLNLLNDPVNLAAFEEYGPALYMPHCYRPGVHYPRSGPLNPELNADLTFVGTAFRSRVEFFEAMDTSGLDILLGGSYWHEELAADSKLLPFVGHGKGDCVANTETAELYRHAKCGINVYRRESEDVHTGEGWAMGPREVEMAACGLWFLRDPRPESDKVLPMLPAFATPEDAGEQLRFWLKHEDERLEAARKARAAIADRTFANNARRLLQAIDQLLYSLIPTNRIREDAVVTGTMSELHPAAGDVPIMWDRTQPDEVAAAQRAFNDLKKKKYLAYKAEGKKGERGEILREFDPDAERIILVRQNVGG